MSRKKNSTVSTKAEFSAYFEGIDKKKRAYIEGRLIEQINWYNQSAIRYKRYFRIFNTLSIFLTCILPCLTTLDVENCWIAVVSTLSVIITTLMNAFDFHNRWIEYRMLCEVMKSNLHQYLTSAGIFSCFSEEEQFNMLVKLSEEYMKKELKCWNAVNLPKGKTVQAEDDS